MSRCSLATVRLSITAPMVGSDFPAAARSLKNLSSAAPVEKKRAEVIAASCVAVNVLFVEVVHQQRATGDSGVQHRLDGLHDVPIERLFRPRHRLPEGHPRVPGGPGRRLTAMGERLEKRVTMLAAFVAPAHSASSAFSSLSRLVAVKNSA